MVPPIYDIGTKAVEDDGNGASDGKVIEISEAFNRLKSIIRLVMNFITQAKSGAE
ncbi:MAG: hypothetical protein Q8M98_05775 [Candidatus Cloacimonadaceae bacterium]|nr:hypothetical protein [Candidatus Cloacimonadaceae bacterium]MDP3114271.1 hypothetical protein [Candidatus Cloacimonadaceae bacterium]